MKKLLITFAVLLLLLVISPFLYLWLQMNGVDGGVITQWDKPSAPAPHKEILPREKCDHYTPLRQVFWGDVHVHTLHSGDARAKDMLATPEDAYNFARGLPITLGGDAYNDNPTTVQLHRPLDFAAVTDHAEQFGETSICTKPGFPGYDSNNCAFFRGEEKPESLLLRIMTLNGKNRHQGVTTAGRLPEICGEDASWCRQRTAEVWQSTQAATERAYDRSPECSFTSFHGWEYSNSAGLSKVHRNVIFRNELVPELPVSSVEEPNALGLWEKMDSLCNQTGTGCEALAIPHNPNASNGRSFVVPYREEPMAEQLRQAELRARMEPLVEMMQIKGESECKNGFWNVFGEDELCDFEKMHSLDMSTRTDCEDGSSSGAVAGFGCQSRLDFARYAVAEGMREEERIGANPYKIGFIGSTDTHNATPGAVEEDNYPGCCGMVDTNPAGRLSPALGFARKPLSTRNPGGLMGVWAEENSRDSLFDAMQRREVFATSGPRIATRFFAGHEIPLDACDNNPVALGYQHGVAMGGEIKAAPSGQAPVFLASAIADGMRSEIDQGLLQRLQVIKVWSPGGEEIHQQVYDIAGDANNGASVDLASCQTHGEGYPQLCKTWQDPDFDPQQAAAYYVRVIENPSCRWTWRDCLQLPEAERPAVCNDPETPRTIQERAWSSPIWYSTSQ